MDFSYIRPETVSSASSAARRGDLVTLRRIVTSSGEDRSWLSVDNRGWGPLHHAAYHGHAACVQYLGALVSVDINSRSWEGETPLFLACKNLPTARDSVHALLKLNANVNITTNERCSPLQYAAVKTDLTVTRWLVRKGARVNHCNVWGETPLHTVMRKTGAESDERLEIVKYLIKHEARIICCDDNQLTPLMLAATKGFTRICETLITSTDHSYHRTQDHVNLRAEDGATALMMAAQSGKLECVETLLTWGADPNIAADDGTMTSHLACIARNNSPQILELVLPATDHHKLRSACNVEPPDPVPQHQDKKVLSPFKLAVDWENWDSLDVLVKHLNIDQFYTPLQFCFLHKDLCPDDSGFCDIFPYRFLNPLAALLSEKICEQSLSKLHLFKSQIHDTKSLPPLVTLLTSSSVDIRRDDFSPDSPAGRALDYLVSEGAAVSESDLLPIFLFGSVSGVFRLISSGLINPHQLISQHYLDTTSNILSRDFSSSTHNQIFELPLISQRLLNIAIISTKCSLLQSDWVQNLALLVLDQFKKILSIDKLVVIDQMYQNLKTPKSLQELSRNQVHASLSSTPRDAIRQLRVPSQIQRYLLYEDIDVGEMIKEYTDTIDHVNENGVSNIIHV